MMRMFCLFPHYVWAVIRHWKALVTGGLVSLYWVIQPHTHLWKMPEELFFPVLTLLVLISTYLAWYEERESGIAASTNLERYLLAADDPKLDFKIEWPNDDPKQKPVKVTVRNRGRFPLLNFRIKPLFDVANSVSFLPIPELQPEGKYELLMEIKGNLSASADLLDYLADAVGAKVHPETIPLEVSIEKINGQVQSLYYELVYRFLNNARLGTRVKDGKDCLIIQEG